MAPVRLRGHPCRGDDPAWLRVRRRLSPRGRYSAGESEEIVGKAIEGRRDSVVLATELGRPMGDDPNQRGASRRWIMTAAENSLRRLRTDRIDLYQIHRPDPDTDIEATLSALSDLIRSGKVRAIGSSAMPASDIVEAQWVAERRGLERFRTEQPTYSILNRGIEAEVLPVCQRYGKGTLVWSPLAKGMLTGRIRKGRETYLRRAALFTSSLTSAGSMSSSSSFRSPTRRGCRSPTSPWRSPSPTRA
jgi:aryl-alcohol dehydrogenase-like predicted oxidoreductase